jgi:hypothetical protein
MGKTPKLGYDWARKWYADADANAVGHRIEAIAKKSGTAFEMAPPKAIVDDARKKTSPLHPLFTWDDAAAAEEWRVQEARQLVKNLVRVVIREESDGEPERVRAFVSVKDEEGNRGYVTTVLAASEPALRRQMVEDALNGLRAWRARYKELSELRPVLDAIEQVEEELNAAPV